MSSEVIKSSDLAKELGVRTSEIVEEIARIRVTEFDKGVKSVDISVEEAEHIRGMFNQDLFLFERREPDVKGTGETPQEAAAASAHEAEILRHKEAVNRNAEPIKKHVLEVKNLTKIYGKRQVVKGVNLSVTTGEIIGLLGPNGAGKTTTFYMIVGLISPDGGDITLDGQDLRSMPMYMRARKGIGYLPQEPSIFRKLTVRQNLEAVLEIAEFEGAPRSRADIKAEVDRLLKEFSLIEFADRDGFRLSGGERRRTEIARAIAVRPTFMLFDEPFAGIDPLAIIELKKMMIYLKSKGLGILVTDHNVRETLSITDRAYIISNGAVLAEGTSDDLVNNPEVKEAYLGEEFRL
jgi:lipopolysaccharide export system ATP-binding protein